MDSKSDNIEIIINDFIEEIIEKIFQSLPSRHQIGLETSMKGSDFIFDCVHLFSYKCHKRNVKRCGSSIGFPDWIKNKTKKTAKNPVSKKSNKYFQHVVTVALNQ